ncbi:copper amine oxidase N-terminal domain-containing protein [Paenibacillus sp. 1P07SE]|uniref:copper amine oxidase N-terminal domain-containing protein n=1 Tax=Paenibacillus sp. 1P07SE TaxID=3132209 RepID=UPI0039A747B1
MKASMIVALFTVTLYLVFGYAAYADKLYEDYEDVNEADLRGSMILSPESAISFIRGQQVSAVQPIVRDGRTLVPLRFVSEGFGAKVDFNAQQKTIAIMHSGNTISLTLGSKTMVINGQSRGMDVVPTVYSNVTYLPLRDIGEALGKKVVYLPKKDFQTYSLIILRDPDATSIENLNLTRVLDLLYQGKSVVYSDRYLVVIKENDQLLMRQLSSSSYADFTTFAYKEYIEVPNETKLGDLWFQTETSPFYLNYAWDTTQEYTLYQVDGEAISRVGIEKAPIKDVKTYQDEVYYLTRYERGILDAHETSNLKKATLTGGKWTSVYLGMPGFYYGYDIMGKPFDWSIEANGLTTLGWHRYGDLGKEERLETLGYYRIDLNGHDHEFAGK